MRDVGRAARWACAASVHIPSLKQADGTPAISPADIGQAIANEWERVCEEVPEPRFSQYREERGHVERACGGRAPAYTEPPVWTPDAIRSECHKSAAGLDGLSYSRCAELPQEHLGLLAECFMMRWIEAVPLPILCARQGSSVSARRMGAHCVAGCLSHLVCSADWADNWLPREVAGGRAGGPKHL